MRYRFLVFFSKFFSGNNSKSIFELYQISGRMIWKEIEDEIL
jgi:hypothetical protein